MNKKTFEQHVSSIRQLKTNYLLMKKTGVLIVNLGTPNSYHKKDVAIYLREFLMDGRVIDIAHWKRWMLVNLIIVPFRAPKVAHEYQKLWMKDGSPLMVYGVQLVEKLNRKFNDSVVGGTGDALPKSVDSIRLGKTTESER